MRKLYLGMAMIMAVMGLISCEKSQNVISNVGDEMNRAELISSGQKSGTLYSMSIQVGHSAAGCPGCVNVEGHTVHVDCQGAGNLCTTSAIVSVQLVSANLYTATTQDSTDLTSEPYFNMPARSLYTGMDDTGPPRWLNIPAQFVLRDSTTRLFTFTGVFFSQQQVYKNQ